MPEVPTHQLRGGNGSPGLTSCGGQGPLKMITDGRNRLSLSRLVQSALVDEDHGLDSVARFESTSGSLLNWVFKTVRARPSSALVVPVLTVEARLPQCGVPCGAGRIRAVPRRPCPWCVYRGCWPTAAFVDVCARRLGAFAASRAPNRRESAERSPTRGTRRRLRHKGARTGARKGARK